MWGNEERKATGAAYLTWTVVGVGWGGCGGNGTPRFRNITDMWAAFQWVPVSVGRRKVFFYFVGGRKAGFGFLPVD